MYTISLPPELAQKAEALARRDSRTMSELFREAFRSYSAQQAQATLDELGEYAASRNPNGYTEADVSRLIQNVRQDVRQDVRRDVRGAARRDARREKPRRVRG